MYNVRIIPTVYKKLGQAPQYSYEISFQESLHRVCRASMPPSMILPRGVLNVSLYWQGLRISPGMTSLNLDAPGRVPNL